MVILVLYLDLDSRQTWEVKDQYFLLKMPKVIRIIAPSITVKHISRSTFTMNILQIESSDKQTCYYFVTREVKEGEAYA